MATKRLTAKEAVLEHAPDWTEEQAQRALNAAESEIDEWGDLHAQTIAASHASMRQLDEEEAAATITELILKFPGIETVTPAGSLRRGRETVGDLDLLVTGPACEPEVVSAAVEHGASLPLIAKMMAKWQNKVAFALRNGMQVDVRLLPKSSYGAALQYLTGSKMHGLAVRQRALTWVYTLSEYALASM